MDKSPVIINQYPFPNQMATEEEKGTEKYGLNVGKAIEGEWFKRRNNSCRFYDQRGEFNRLRLYA